MLSSLRNPSGQRECVISVGRRKCQWAVSWIPSLERVDMEKALSVTDGWGLDEGEQEPEEA